MRKTNAMSVAALLGMWLGGCAEPSHSQPPETVSQPAPPKQAQPAGQQAEDEAQSEDPSRGYQVPLRSDEQLQRELTATCKAAKSAGRPWLLELSAEWCGDCRALHGLKQQPPLRNELSDWPKLVVNVGHFDRHEALRKRLGVRAIAHWAVMAPAQCERAASAAPVLEQRTLEPRSGQPVTAASLAEWLRDARAQSSP